MVGRECGVIGVGIRAECEVENFDCSEAREKDGLYSVHCWFFVFFFFPLTFP